MIFVMGFDEGSSQKEFQVQKEIVKKMIASETISNSATLIGVVIYGSDSIAEVPLGSLTDRDQLLRRIDTLNGQSPSSEGIKEGLQLANTEMQYSTRQNAARSIILFTTKAPFYAKNSISNLEKDGMKVIVVGVGEKVAENDIKDVTGNDNVFVVKDNYDVDKVVGKITDSSRPGKKPDNIV